MERNEENFLKKGEEEEEEEEKREIQTWKERDPNTGLWPKQQKLIQCFVYMYGEREREREREFY